MRKIKFNAFLMNKTNRFFRFYQHSLSYMWFKISAEKLIIPINQNFFLIRKRNEIVFSEGE